ncbi:uncharacterized protein LOC123192605 [Mangifera indica]|uniref:uncharacterized protein LOC123192605 n=1 Tax=Mangifera indica TaxID=29780 RepID=UPI001CFB75B0|nr:uncharacterized protein LOC123192605 [Mangifera indica]
MGIKLLNLQMIPWCLHFLGNPISCLQLQSEQSSGRTIKLIKSDGLVKIYDHPIHVSELMMEFPKHLVCRSDSFYIGQKIPALSGSDQLQLGHKYFLLPKHCFQSVLSFLTIASFASPQAQSSSAKSRNAFLKKAASCQPFDIQKSPSGCGRIRVSDEFISQLMEEGIIKEEDEEEETFKSKICTTAQLQKDYTQLVGSSRQWKPKLETIKEKEKRRLSSFGIKRRKKSQSKGNHLHLHHHHNITSTKPPLKSKIKIKSRKGW